MAKVAEFAHIPHTRTPGFRLGRAPYYQGDSLNFVQADARRKFIEVVNQLARPAVQSLLDTAAAHGYDPRNCPFDEWARRFSLTKGGKTADWVLYSARLTAMTWQAIPDLRVPVLLGFQQMELGVKQPTLGPSDCRISLREVAWNPLGPALNVAGAQSGETRAECRQRIVMLLDGELARIERAIKRRGGRPCPVKRDDQHFEWAVRFQVNCEPIRRLATYPEGQRTVRAGIKSLLTVIGLDARREATGRPRKTR